MIGLRDRAAPLALLCRSVEGMIGIMSSTASVVFLVVGLFWKITDRGKIRYWFLAALAGYALSSFMAWFRIRPDLKIDIEQTSLDLGVTFPQFSENLIRSATLGEESSYVTLTLCIVNTRSADNSIKEYRLTIYLKGRWRRSTRIRGELVTTHGLMPKETTAGLVDLNEFKYHVLKQGQPSPPGWIRFSVPCSKEHIVKKKFMLTVKDVYNVKHKVRGALPSHTTDDIAVDANS